MTYKAGICGATGYTGLELIRLIDRHPELEVGWITSQSSAGKRFSDVHAGPWDTPLITMEEGMARADEVDVVFLCLPHAASIEPVRKFSETGVRVIDLSADYRLRDLVAPDLTARASDAQARSCWATIATHRSSPAQRNTPCGHRSAWTLPVRPSRPTRVSPGGITCRSSSSTATSRPGFTVGPPPSTVAPLAA